MIDHFSLALSHGLMFLAAWRLLFRSDLDVEPKAVAANARDEKDNRPGA
jgi:hypothetical protein